MSETTQRRKKKTQAQRRAQSEKLIARFQTEAGEITRQQIAKASRQMQSGPSGDRSKEHLRKYNSDPIVVKQRGLESRARWAEGTLRAELAVWRKEHASEVQASAANARKAIKHKRTKVHMYFKSALISSGLEHFITEYEFDFYCIDEARPDIKLAVEIDGCYWHGCETCGFPGLKGNRRMDASKNAYLCNRGWTVLRIKEHEIHASLGDCVARVQATVKQLSEVLTHAI